MANITDFKLVGDSRTITKVRVSMDNGNTWGVLYTKDTYEIYAQCVWIDSPTSVIEIPYNGSVAYPIGYNVLKEDEFGNVEELELELTIPYTFNYSDCKDGLNDFVTTIEYDGKNYDLEFSANIKLQPSYYFVVEPDENPIYLELNVNNGGEISYTDIAYTVYEHDRSTDERMGEHSTGQVVSDAYCFDNYEADYSWNSSTIATVPETHRVTVDGEEYEFEVEIILINPDYEEPTDKTIVGMYIYDAKVTANDYSSGDGMDYEKDYEITDISIRYKYSDGSVSENEIYTGDILTGTCPAEAEYVTISGYQYGGYTAPDYDVYF